MTIDHEFDINTLLNQMQIKYPASEINLADGIRMDMEKEWVHVRKSNTEPVFRVIAESENEDRAQIIVRKIINLLKTL